MPHHASDAVGGAYISYAPADRAWVHEWLVPALEAAGVRVLMDERDFDVGVPRLENITRFVGQSSHTLIVLSRAWVASEWSVYEGLLARSGDPAASLRRTLPLVLEPCSVPAWLEPLHAADFTNSDRWSAAFERLLAALRGEPGAANPESLVRQISASGTPFLVPYARNSGIVGRDADLDRLRGLLHPEARCRRGPVALMGLGGIGKTQLALAYVYRHREEYPGGIYWLNAARPLLDEFASLAEALGIADRTSSVDHAARTAWSYLDARVDALVVFDNVIEPHHLNQPLTHGTVPLALRSAMLITTRDRRVPRGVQAFPVQPISEGAALQILLRARPDTVPTEGRGEEVARAICTMLGRLPLALELAASYLERYREVTLEGYAGRLRDEGRLATLDDLAGSDVTAELLPTRHAAAVAATLEAQWARLADPSARLVFQAAGQLGEGTFVPTARLSLMTGLAATAPPGRVSPLSQALAHLLDLSLVEELAFDRLRLHPLVQEFSYGTAAPGLRGELAARVADALGNAERLEREVILRGIDAVLDDLRSAVDLLGGAAADGKCQSGEALRAILRVLDRDAYNLRSWDPAAAPGHFLQQVIMRARSIGEVELALSAERCIRARGAAWLSVKWRVGSNGAELLRVLTGPNKYRITSLAAFPDGKRVAAGSIDGIVTVWNVDTGRAERAFAVPQKSTWRDDCHIGGLAVFPDNERIATGTSDGLVRIWSVQTGALLQTFAERGDRISGLVVLPCGGKLASTSFRTFRLWNVDTGDLEWEHENTAVTEIYSLALLSDGHTLAGGTDEGVLSTWDTSARRHAWHEIARSRDLFAVAGRGDGTILIGGVDTELVLFDPDSDSVHAYSGHDSYIYAIVDLNERQVVTSSTDRTLRVWDTYTWTVARVLGGHVYAIKSLTALPDGRRIVSADDALVRVWDLGSFGPAEGAASAGEIVRLAALPEGRVLARAKFRPQFNMWIESQPLIFAWNLETGCETAVLEGDEQRLGGTSSRMTGAQLSLWNGWSVCIGCETDNGINSVLALPDGREITIVWDNSTLRVGDTAQGSEPRNLDGHTDTVWAAVSLPDGRIATASSDMTVRVWNVENGICLLVLRGHEEPIPELTVLASGRIVSVSLDQTLRVWDHATGKQLAVYRGEAAFLCVTATPDGQGVVAGDAAGGVYRFIFEELADH
ncbi:MAG TPA: TIR domain-containing protein [Longimicrobiaceae bacterium]|nr:TIR domain-containing protein [Longimicrobiaceae bacterium]